MKEQKDTIAIHYSRLFIALHGGAVVFCAILFIALWDCIDLKRKRISSKRIKYFSILSITMYTISSILILIYFILLPNDLIISREMDYVFKMSWGMFWRFGQSFLYLLFLERLKHSFRNTKYSSSNKTFCWFYIGITIFLFSYFIKTSIYCYIYLHNHDYVDTDSSYAIVGDIDMIIMQIIDLSISIGIMTLFLNKLYKLNVDLIDPETVFGSQIMMSSQSGSINSIQKQRDIPLNRRQKSIIGIMAKITLLSGIALASTQIVLFIRGAACISLIVPSYRKKSELIWLLSLGYFAINAVIISLSITLSFDFSYKWYKNFCNRIDKMCVKCCTWGTKKKMKKISSRDRDPSIDTLLTSNRTNISTLSSPAYNAGYNIGSTIDEEDDDEDDDEDEDIKDDFEESDCDQNENSYSYQCDERLIIN